MAKISVMGRECDRLCKKTRMPVALDLTLSQHMHSGGGTGDRLFPLVFSFNHAGTLRTVPWVITVLMATGH